MMMKSKTTVFAHMRVHGESRARAFPTVSAARAFVLGCNDRKGLTAMRIEVRITAEDLDNVEWSEALDEALLG